MIRFFFLIVVLLAASAEPAVAHSGGVSISVNGMLAGVAHPFIGLDHLLAMTAIGVLAAQRTGRMMAVVPASSIGAMLVAALLVGAHGLVLPAVGTGALFSVIVLGAAVMVGRSIPDKVLLALVVLAAMYHGQVYALNKPAGANGLDYGIGFAMGCAFLHAVGAGFSMAAHMLGEANAFRFLRLCGVIVAAAGLALVAF